MGKEKDKIELIETKFLLDTPPLISHNRKKEDFLILPPTTGTDRFNENVIITYKVTNTDNYLYLPESFLRCEFEIKKEDNTALGNENITLENNWFPNLFESVIFRIGSTEIEHINHPGECDSMLKLIMKNQLYSNDGWILDRGDGKAVTDFAKSADYKKAEIDPIIDKLNTMHNRNSGFMKRKELYNTNPKNIIEFHLSPLIGYLDYDKISHNLTFELELRRNLNNPRIFFGAANTNAKIDIKRLDWLIPKITPSLEIETMITKRLLIDKPIPVNFLRRSIYQITIDSSHYTWAISSMKNVPHYILLTFKPSKQAAFTDNNSLTVQKWTENNVVKKLKKLQVKLDQTAYPLYPMEFDLENNKYSDAYIAYTNLCKTFGVENQLNKKEFNDLHPIFCFDVSAFPEKTNPGGINITIEIEKDDNSKLIAYCLVLEEESRYIHNVAGKMNRID